MTIIEATYEGRTVTEKKTADLRWSKDGKLQQAVEILEYNCHKIVNGHIEWRDVPIEM